MPTIAEIASLIGAAAPEKRDALARELRGVAALADAGADDLSFVGSDAYLNGLAHTRAAAVIVRRGAKLPPEVSAVVLTVDDVELALSRALDRFAPPPPQLPLGVDRAARVDPTACVGEGARVGPFVVIGARARVGERCAIHAGAFVGEDAVVGDDCTLWPNVVVRERVTLGRRVTVHAGAVIGSDGFGYRWDGARHAKVPQIGTVVIEDDVEIGSCACVDRAKVGVTRVGRGTKIDNLVQVAHNCTVGEHCVLAGQAGLAGSVTLGAGVVLGGGTSVSDHLTMGPGAMAAGRSGIATDIDAGARVSGMPALPHRQNLREQAALRRLPELISQIRRMEEEIAALKRRSTETENR